MQTRSRIRLLAVLLLGLHAVILFAGFFAPYDPAEQDRTLPYAPPTRLHFTNRSGWHLRPFIYGVITDDGEYREDHTRQYLVHFFVRGNSYSCLGIFESNLHWFGVQGPSRLTLLGTDEFGRDEFSRLLFGGQISLAAGILATLLTLAIAAVIGAVAGFYGGWVDESLMGMSELFLCLPWLYFLLGIRAFLPLHVSSQETFVLLVGVLGLIGWARPARLVRAAVLSVRTRNHVSAARGFGGSDLYLLRRHILPETAGVLLTQAALLVPLYVSAEATLSFFGLGVSEPVPSWGNMLSALQHYSVLVSFHWLLAPAAALVVTSVIYRTLANWLHPRHS